MIVLRWLWNLGCYLARTTALHYGMTSFELKTLGKCLALYSSVYYIGHIIPVVIIVLDIITKRKGTKAE
jgi:hypothetical protein